MSNNALELKGKANKIFSVDLNNFTLKQFNALITNKKLPRHNFARVKTVLEYPDFLDIQLQSFKDFFQLETAAESRDDEGLFKVFAENFPIADSRENFVLEFIDYTVDAPKYSTEV